jgi:glycerol kinase
LSLLAIDAGTDGVTARVVGPDGAVLATGHHAFGSRLPRPGWVEHAPEEVWRATLAAVRTVLTMLTGVDAGALGGLGITDAHDTLVVWDRETLGAPRPALAAPDTRAESAQMGHRLAWLAEHEHRTWARVEAGEYAVGGLASYLVTRLTRGTWHVTDVAQAARTGLLDLGSGQWSDERCAAAGVPRDALPEVVASWGVVDRTDDRSFCGLDLPIAGLAAAGAARLLARGGAARGDATYAPSDGTLLVTTGAAPADPVAGLWPAPVWRAPDGGLTRALHGTVDARAVPGVLAAVSDALGVAVEHAPDASAGHGAAYLAGLGTGVWASPRDLPAHP